MGSVTAKYLEVVAGNWIWILVMLTSMGGLSVRLGLGVHGATLARAQLFGAWQGRMLACLWVAVVFACLSPFLVLPLVSGSEDYCSISRMIETPIGWEKLVKGCTSAEGELRSRNATILMDACMAEGAAICVGEQVRSIGANASLIFAASASMPNLVTVDGTLVFTGPDVIEVHLPLLQGVAGNVSLRETKLREVVLDRLREIHGSVEIARCKKLTSANFTALSLLRGTLSIFGNDDSLVVRLPVFYDSAAVATQRLLFDGSWPRLTCLETEHRLLFYDCFQRDGRSLSCFCPPLY
jgi:hypothetical protein